MSIGPCHWSVNIVDIVAIAVAYGSAACAMTNVKVLGTIDNDVYSKGESRGPAHALDISGYALIMLGCALCIKNLISAWILVKVLVIKPGMVRTFSSNPVVNALHMSPNQLQLGELGSRPSTPRSTVKHYSAKEQVRYVRILGYIFWIGFAGLLLTCFLTSIFAAKRGTFQASAYQESPWEFFGQVETPVGFSSKFTDWAGESLSVTLMT